MKSSLALAVALLLGFVSADFYNNVPIPGRRPEYTVGDAKQGIDLTIIYDLMCSDSAALAPEFNKFLDSTWNVTNTKVSDAIRVTYSFLPLPYHHEVWMPHRLVPYFLDQCQFGAKCQMMDYINFCFANQDDILDAKDTSANALLLQWTSKVSSTLDIPQAELLAVFNNAYDTHNSEMRTREMYKWNTHHRTSGTPFGYVNGVLLENFPEKSEEWMDVLQAVYNNQYKPKTSQKRDL